VLTVIGLNLDGHTYGATALHLRGHLNRWDILSVKFGAIPFANRLHCSETFADEATHLSAPDRILGVTTPKVKNSTFRFCCETRNTGFFGRERHIAETFVCAT
jgi:hypothetical protein